MFASRSIVLFFIFALSAKVLAGIPPACLLAAVNTQPNPADLKSICGPENSKKVENEIMSKCGKNVKPAMDAFSSTCKSAGVTVATPSVTGFSSGMPTNSANGTFMVTTQFFNSSCSCTQTSVITSSKTPQVDTPTPTTCIGDDCTSGSGSASATVGSASSTGSGASGGTSSAGAAAAVEQHSAFAAAAIALAGLVAIL